MLLTYSSSQSSQKVIIIISILFAVFAMFAILITLGVLVWRRSVRKDLTDGNLEKRLHECGVGEQVNADGEGTGVLGRVISRIV